MAENRKKYDNHVPPNVMEVFMDPFDVNPNVKPYPPSERKRFSACDSIDEFYTGKSNVSIKRSKMPWGKKFTWHVSAPEGTYLLDCFCNVTTLGNGILNIRPSLDPSKARQYQFRKNPVVNENTGIVYTITPFLGISKEVQLPFPERNKKV
jgi:hypothetical protein